MSTLIIDYEMGNLGSVRRSLEECGADVRISNDPKDLKFASNIVLPGVGSYSDGMNSLNKNGWVDPIKCAVSQDKIPLLGICLGMQLLSDYGYEGGETKGLGIIPGKVIKIEKCSNNERIPHTGWNEVYHNDKSQLFSDIPDGADFYFVHSYCFMPENDNTILATTPYCGTVVSSISKDCVFGVQFHPEKSSRAGFQLLRNFLHII